MTFIKVTFNSAASNLQNFVQIKFECAISTFYTLFDASERKVFNVICTESTKKEAHLRIVCSIKDAGIFIALHYL